MPLKLVVKSSQAPAAIGLSSQAIVAGGWLFISGQIPIDPGTGEMIPGDISAQAARVLENLRAILKEAGKGMDSVVRTTVYLADLSEFAAMNEVYGRYFPDPFPARATVEVSALPRGARLEIDAIAIV